MIKNDGGVFGRGLSTLAVILLLFFDSIWHLDRLEECRRLQNPHLNDISQGILNLRVKFLRGHIYL